MSKKDPLDMILLLIPELGENAYAVPIRGRLEEITGKQYSLGSIYGMLGFLDVREMVDWYLVPGGPERGNRPKKIWTLKGQAPPTDGDMYRVEKA
jgi:hypothetical protein